MAKATTAHQNLVSLGWFKRASHKGEHVNQNILETELAQSKKVGAETCCHECGRRGTRPRVTGLHAHREMLTVTF